MVFGYQGKNDRFQTNPCEIEDKNGESVRYDSGEITYKGHPFTVVVPLRETGRWDVEAVYAPSCVQYNLDGITQRGGEGIALAKDQVGIVVSVRQAWTTIIAPTVVGWRVPER